MYIINLEYYLGDIVLTHTEFTVTVTNYHKIFSNFCSAYLL